MMIRTGTKRRSAYWCSQGRVTRTGAIILTANITFCVARDQKYGSGSMLQQTPNPSTNPIVIVATNASPTSKSLNRIDTYTISISSCITIKMNVLQPNMIVWLSFELSNAAELNNMERIFRMRIAADARMRRENNGAIFYKSDVSTRKPESCTSDLVERTIYDVFLLPLDIMLKSMRWRQPSTRVLMGVLQQISTRLASPRVCRMSTICTSSFDLTKAIETAPTSSNNAPMAAIPSSLTLEQYPVVARVVWREMGAWQEVHCAQDGGKNGLALQVVHEQWQAVQTPGIMARRMKKTSDIQSKIDAIFLFTIYLIRLGTNLMVCLGGLRMWLSILSSKQEWKGKNRQFLF